MDKLPRPAAALFERFTVLSDREQLLTYAAIRDYLRAADHKTEISDELDDRAKAVELVVTVSASLGLDDQRQLSVKAFDATSERIREGWKSGRVISAWGKWRFAREAAAGEHSRSTARQVAIRSAAGARRLLRDDYITAVRAWLATDPPKFSVGDYDKWRREEHERHPGELSYPGSGACKHALGLVWKETLRVARGEITLAQAQKARGGVPRPSFSRGRHELVSPMEIVARTGRGLHIVERWAQQPGFPKPVLVFGTRRIWLAGDVDAFVAGRPVPKRRRNELAHVYVSSVEVAKMLGISHASVWKLKPRLEPIAAVGGRSVWLRKDVVARRAERKRLGVRVWPPPRVRT